MTLLKRRMPLISTVILNWNRLHLLKVTVESYLATLSVPYELIIVDNSSSDGSKVFIQEICKRDSRHKAIFLTENLGGEAINLGIRLAQGSYLHISENDIEYLPGWDEELLSKFEVFPELGQLSFFAPDPEGAQGEIWERHAATSVTRGRHTIYLTTGNIGTTCLCRRELRDRGLRWRTYPFQLEPGGRIKMPDDVATSNFVRQLGYWVAWNDKYTCKNWGHNVQEWQEHLDYYLEGYRAKPWLGQEGMRQRLLAHGYDLMESNGQYKIVKL